jgi:hypothetical protein
MSATNWKDELAVPGREGIIVSAIIAVAGFTAFVLVADLPRIPVRVFLGLLIAAIMFTYGFLVSYIYADAKRRGMRSLLWALIAFFVPNALGVIVYFLFREPVLKPCAACGATTRKDFAFCPQCGSPLPRVCPSCHRPVEPVWPHCAHCGHKLLGESAATPASGNAAL